MAIVSRGLGLCSWSSSATQSWRGGWSGRLLGAIQGGGEQRS